MPNITKPELERGNFIAYSDEPNTIVDNAGGGGGGGEDLILELSYDADLEYYVLDTVITYNEVKAAFDAGKKIYYVAAYETETGAEETIGILRGFNLIEQYGEVTNCFVSFTGPNSADYEFTATSLDDPLSI